MGSGQRLFGVTVTEKKRRKRSRQNENVRRKERGRVDEGALEGEARSWEAGGGCCLLTSDVGAQHGQAEPSELQWRSGSPTFLWNTVFTLCSRGEGGGGSWGFRGGQRTGKEIISRLQCTR